MVLNEQVQMTHYSGLVLLVRDHIYEVQYEASCIK